MKFLVAASAVIFLAGCDFEVYRYPCQDPANWNSEECQKPLCEVSRTCPEHIFKGEEKVISEAVTQQSTPKVTSNKGGCK